MRSTCIGDPALAVSYLRSSTVDQRLGPEVQRKSIEEWATRTGVRVVAWHLDLGVSGGSDVDARPGLTRALVDLRAHRAGTLAIATRDRLARDVGIAIAIERAVMKQGARVVSVDGTGNGDDPSDELLRVILSGMAQFERALIRARTKAALQAKRAQGFRAGAVPYGYAADETGRLHRCVDEQRVIAEVQRLRREGRSLREVVRACADLQLRSRAASPFGLTQVSRILRTNGIAAVDHG